MLRDDAPEMEEHAALRAERRREEEIGSPSVDGVGEALLRRGALEVDHAAHSPSPVWTRKPVFSPMSASSSGVACALTTSPSAATTFLPSMRSKNFAGDSPGVRSASKR